jgi:hypothetical protein
MQIKLTSLFFVLVIFSPSFAHAAGNDVTLTTSANILVNGITLNISGSSAVIESITVNSSDFTVTLASGSSISIFAPGLNQLDNDVTSDVVSSICTSGESSLALEYSGVGTVTNTITPRTTLCTSPSAISPDQTSHTSSSGSFFPAIRNAIMQAIFGPSKAASFTSNLSTGSRGLAVSDLQTWLIAHGYDIPAISSGAAAKGFFGLQTQRAVMYYQRGQGIPPTGFFGPLTRASLNGKLMLPTIIECPEGYTCRPI